MSDNVTDGQVQLVRAETNNLLTLGVIGVGVSAMFGGSQMVMNAVNKPLNVLAFSSALVGVGAIAYALAKYSYADEMDRQKMQVKNELDNPSLTR